MDPFLQLKTVSQSTEDLLYKKDDTKFIRVYGDNYVYPLSANDLIKDSNIQALIHKFEIEISKKITIFRLYPNTCYNWHTDGIRSCAINMQLTAFEESFTLFGKYTESRMIYDNVVRLNYEPNRFYLFNTGIPHTVYNFSHTRYLLSMGIPKKFSYQEVKDFIIENSI